VVIVVAPDVTTAEYVTDWPTTEGLAVDETAVAVAAPEEVITTFEAGLAAVASFVVATEKLESG
jgi:hypothetical protein